MTRLAVARASRDALSDFATGALILVVAAGIVALAMVLG